MAFWLARERRGQMTDYIQRFDPRFWTVNFPRPMMASVVTTAPDALRVDCEFWHRGELAGLIWESEDTLDHPLIAYATRRDYAHCVLRFRWRSGGVVALDQVNGPTLTIEGRDAGGAAKTWYVRLWNYASGSGTDAQVELRFSDLASGWTLPGEPVHPGDIDRMFVSLVPPDYLADSTERYAQQVSGWAELSAMRCEGQDASLEIGDPFLPVHGEQMATAYDDCCNQTPPRLVRSIERLGYRGRICHYVGMSHYPRLRNYSGALLVDQAGQLCEPARRWHAAYFARACEAGFAPIVSLSYELLLDICPNKYKQRFNTGTPARTGWEPPSCLLAPTSSEATSYLASVAGQFVGLLEAAGCPVLFQIGEPWWWIDPASHAIALYDASAKAALASDTVPAITDMRLPLSQAQKDLLDRAGAALAASTATVAQAVRTAAAGAAEVMLLVFTPTVLDPATPEARRANLPTGWAHPAYDRLQAEDYDWVIAGRDGDRAAGRATLASRLGYPLAKRDYMSGFVLLADDADRLWPRIDAALDEARDEGIAQRFVWALPQVSRDGFTRLPPMEDELQPFDDLAYPLPLGSDTSASPEFSTTVAVTASGYEHRNALWSDARMRYDVGPGVRSEADLGTLLGFFRARMGPARGFRLRDPFDFSSNGMTGTPAATDQPIGTGDGTATVFALCKRYGEQVRPITRPVAASVTISVGGVATTAFTLGNGGTITLATAPAPGVQVRAGFLFDVPVRFAEDRIDISALTLGAGEAPSIPLVEVREAR